MDSYVKDFIASVATLGSDIIINHNRKKGYKLKKESRYARIKFESALIKKFKELNEKNTVTSDYRDYIVYFDHVINYFLPQNWLENYRRNIGSLKINRLHFQLGDFIDIGRFSGRYDSNTNTIKMNANSTHVLSIFHELFHLASNNMNSRNIGFSFLDRYGIQSGRSLNEGYTDLLTERYFSQIGYTKVYDIESIYASLIERIVGMDKMVECYLKADMKSLALELQKYQDINTIYQFVKSLDNIDDNRSRIETYNRYTSMAYFLIQTYIRKKILYNENIFDRRVKDDIINFINQIPGTISYDNQVIKIDLGKITDEIVDDLVRNSHIIRR